MPDLPLSKVSGIEVTRLGHRHKAEPVVRTLDPRGEPVYWVGPPGSAQDAGPGTDFHAVHSGRISVTPLQVDLTRHGALGMTASWVEEISIA